MWETPRPEHLCEFVAATDQVFASDLVMDALSDGVAPLFLVAGATGNEPLRRAL